MYGYNNYQYPTYVNTGLPDYRQQMQFPQQQPQSTQQQNTTQNNGMIWVQGEAGAKSYLIAPSSAVTLWDSEDKIFYIKSANASGMPSLQKFSYCEITDNSNVKNETNVENIGFDGSKFVTREEYADLQNKIQTLESIINRNNNNQQQQNKGGKNNG